MGSEDHWVDITARDERKRRQNRINQRAARLRKKKQADTPGSKHRPYHVDRWRIGPTTEHRMVQYSSSSPECDTPSPEILHYSRFRALTLTQDQVEDVASVLLQAPENAPVLYLSSNQGSNSSPDESSHLQLPLSSDHLLHLIHHNVYRALLTNKVLLGKTTFLTKPCIQGPIATVYPSTTRFCDGLTVIHPTVNQYLPQSLYPTSLQRTQPHSSWLNMFPFPHFRDNLITWEDTFDANDLCYDLFGDLFTNDAFSSSSDIISESSTSDVESDSSASRRGLIVWGEPWDIEGWEVTPAFIRKWAWLLEGCEYLIHSSNRWRATRGEEPLQLLLEIKMPVDHISAPIQPPI